MNTWLKSWGEKECFVMASKKGHLEGLSNLQLQIVP